jgi:hypothetical protein
VSNRKNEAETMKNILRSKGVMKNMRFNQMSLFRRARIPPHKSTIEIRRSRADVLRKFSSQLQRARQDLGWIWQGFIEQIAKMLGSRRENRAGADEVIRVGEADQPWEEV